MVIKVGKASVQASLDEVHEDKAEALVCQEPGVGLAGLSASSEDDDPADDALGLEDGFARVSALFNACQHVPPLIKGVEGLGLLEEEVGGEGSQA